MYYTMADMKPGQIGYVTMIKCKNDIKRRLMDMGLIEKTKIECIMESPQGDPVAYKIRNTLVAIRKIDAKEIYIDVESEEYKWVSVHGC